jgi:4-hydroxy-tetrahydrodipicolinate reductase
MGGGERLELLHRATSRDVFAYGALHAARWIAGKPAGTYTLRDVLSPG